MTVHPGPGDDGDDDLVDDEAFEASGNAPGGIVVEGRGSDRALVTVEKKLPSKAFVFPLRRSVPFPELLMPVLVDGENAREVIAKAEAHGGHVLLLTLKNEDNPTDPAPDDLYDVGVLGTVRRTLKLPDGNASAMIQGVARVRVTRFARKKQPLVAAFEPMVEIPASGKRAEALIQTLRETLGKVGRIGDGFGEEFGTAVLNIENGDQLADFTGAYVLQDTSDKQRILSLSDVEARLEFALEKVVERLQIAELGQKIQDEIRRKTEEQQKKFFLREQLKIIRRELGEETDAREAELERLQNAIEEAGMPEHAAARAHEELTRLKTTPAESAEYSVLRNYLDWLTGLPWSKSSADRIDLDRAKEVLEEDHYGLDEVKERILEFLAVRKLQPKQAGSILCLSGPPGVGKTSLGRSIARATGREFWRFSLGGMRDEAEIKGHRRTYIGAMPGRILQGLKACGTNNPVLLLDEIDKLGKDVRGDPSSALLEVLDPEQNNSFLDHYLDLPFDLSRVMFLATANVLPQIPEPLRDRMEIIELPGYLLDEKVQIAKRHLLPKQIERHGLLKKHLSLSVPVLRRVVEGWTREAGVRGLEKQMMRLCRKAAAAVAARRKPPGALKREDLDKFLGPPRYEDEAERRTRVPGVVQGLAWTPLGGDVLHVEATSTKGKGNLQLTGSLGDVMSESAKIALTFLRSRAADFGIDPDVFQTTDLHVHFPAGAIPKDGPSAGITICCALISCLTGKVFPSDLAMTGELTLVGEVLPIGGVREKVLAAKRRGLARVILPVENKRDVDELLRKGQLAGNGLKFVFADVFDDVFAEAFGDGAKGRGRGTTRRVPARGSKSKPGRGKKAAEKGRSSKKPGGRKTSRKPSEASSPSRTSQTKAAKSGRRPSASSRGGKAGGSAGSQDARGRS
jgi:ATP-dependent Lon protease